MNLSAKTLLPVVKESVDIPALMESLFDETEDRHGMMFCPFHDHHRDSPSLQIRADGARWVCYSCGKGGDSIDFWRTAYWRKSGRELSFAGAVTSLAAFAGIEVNGVGDEAALLLIASVLRTNPHGRKDQARGYIEHLIDERMVPLIRAVRYCGTSGAAGKADWLAEMVDDLRGGKPYSYIMVKLPDLEAVARGFLRVGEDVAEFAEDA